MTANEARYLTWRYAATHEPIKAARALMNTLTEDELDIAIDKIMPQYIKDQIKES